jgi:curved DNA-binding protein CbpA
MEALDPYRVLQVVPDAEDEVLHAAFRALAGKYHPDRDATSRAARRMRELNQAYAMVREPALRAAYDSSRRPDPVQEVLAAFKRGTAVPPVVAAEGTRIAFGRYAGWRLADVAAHDVDYLRWLARHSSGLRYRTEIYQILMRMGASAA